MVCGGLPVANDPPATVGQRREVPGLVDVLQLPEDVPAR